MNESATRFLIWTLEAFGLLSLLGGAVFFAWPAEARRAAKAFPRCKPAGIALCAVCMAWIVWLMEKESLGFLGGSLGAIGGAGLVPHLPWLLPVLGVAMFGAVVWALDELLAVRSLGGLVLLGMAPLLDGLRFATAPSPRVWAWHQAAVTVVYALILLASLWVLRPWTFRTAGEWWARKPLIRKLAGAAFLMGGVAAMLGGLDIFLG